MINSFDYIIYKERDRIVCNEFGHEKKKEKLIEIIKNFAPILVKMNMYMYIYKLNCDYINLIFNTFTGI